MHEGNLEMVMVFELAESSDGIRAIDVCTGEDFAYFHTQDGQSDRSA